MKGGEAMKVVYYMGERIYLRPIELEDEPLLRQWINNPEIWQTTTLRPPMNAVRERQWIESLGKKENEYDFGIVVKDDDRLIGSTGLSQIHPFNRSAMFGIMIGDTEYQNQGYGTQATRLTVRYGFEELNLNRIWLRVYANNPRAIWTYQKAGFIQEGCLRQAYYRNGQYHDEYLFAILREVWEQRDNHESCRQPAECLA
ncbi:MAG: GNAT family N-acetyltransferase [Planctomycetota bacterium]|jgi:RimJ/RimL family protein N-acetyltransferase